MSAFGLRKLEVGEDGAFQGGLPDGHKDARSEGGIWNLETAQDKLALDGFILTLHGDPNRIHLNLSGGCDKTPQSR